MNGTTPKPINDEKPEVVRTCPYPVQSTERNLVHVTKAQMKGDIP